MKYFATPLVIAIAALTMSVGAANAQANHVSTVSGLSLASDPGTDIVNVTTSGTLTGVACVVNGTVSGSPAWGLYMSIDGGGPVSFQSGGYNGSVNWTGSSAMYKGTGASIGDSFFIPMHKPFTTSLEIFSNRFISGSSGTLTCSAFYN